MQEIFTRYFENLIARTDGPLNLRFFIQPTVSLIFALRAAFKDAKEGNIPFLWRFFFSKEQRMHVAKDGWKDFGKIFIVGIVFDIIYQLIMIFKVKATAYFYPLESITVATCLAVLPYILFRGPTNRLVSWLMKKK
jgi:hypothetical protein